MMKKFSRKSYGARRKTPYIRFSDKVAQFNVAAVKAIGSSRVTAWFDQENAVIVFAPADSSDKDSRLLSRSGTIGITGFAKMCGLNVPSPYLPFRLDDDGRLVSENLSEYQEVSHDSEE